MIKEHDCVVLTSDIPDEGLQAGDVGTVVHIHRDGAAYEVEFVTLTGQTVAVATVLPSRSIATLSRILSFRSWIFATSRPDASSSTKVSRIRIAFPSTRYARLP